MTGSVTDLIFPPRILPELSEVRGKEWHNLIGAVLKSGHKSNEETAFVVLMARLNNCAACNTDSFRLSHGCGSCSKQALKRFRGTDEELIKMFTVAQSEVIEYLHPS